MKKYEIIIEPENGQNCGKCTFLGEITKKYFIGPYYQYYCSLFKKDLNFKDGNDLPERCGNCKILCETFEKLPEIDPQ